MKFSRAAAAAVMVAGLSLILYPAVANRINQAANGKKIDDYRREVRSIDAGKYRKTLDAAREYNAVLAEKTPYIGELTAERRAVYDSLLNVGGNGIIGYIEVPKADIYLAIYHGTSEKVLQAGVGHLEASSLPVGGKSVHTVLMAHSGQPSAKLFTDLDMLEAGDVFMLHVLDETLTYEVEEMRRVLPEDLEDMRIEEGRDLCTLITCTPYGVNTHRLVVRGSRIANRDGAGTRPSSLKRTLTSRWNWKFIVLPAAVLALAAVVAAVLIRKKG